jgi:hypothetical protein
LEALKQPMSSLLPHYPRMVELFKDLGGKASQPTPTAAKLEYSACLHLPPKSRVAHLRSKVKQVFLYLGAFGAPTAKPIYLWTTSSWLCELQAYKIPKGTKFQDDEVCKKSVTKSGKNRSAENLA